MAEFTSFATRFWEDPYIQSLPPTDKLLYIYLISGPQSEPSLGIYELSVNTMAFHTGLDKENIEHTLNRFAQAAKIHHIDGWIIIKNHFKHNSVKSERVLIGAYRRLKQVPWPIAERLTKADDTLYIPYLDPQHTLYIGSADDMHTVGTRPLPGGPSDPTQTLSPARPGPSSRRSAGSRRRGEDVKSEFNLTDEETQALRKAGEVD